MRSWPLGTLFAAALLCALPAHADALAPDAARSLALATFAGDFELPTAIEFLPDGRLVVVEKTGRVLVRLLTGETVVAGRIDVDAKTEKGLLNVIRHPRFARNRDLIFYYSAKEAPDLDKHRVALIRLDETNRLDLSSERIIVKGLRGPDDHEMGGGLAIDRSGHLLVGVGDTGCRARKLPEPPYTPTNYFATCLTNGNGKILRVALDGSIPADNPLAAVADATACGAACGDDPFLLPKGVPRRDVWAWGLRNPWRIWVDPKTGVAWTGDVGDIAHEEIDLIPPEGGRHYGWPWREGPAGHPVSECRRASPDRGDCVEPAYACRHDDVPGAIDAGCKSINGGLILDDCRWPDDYRGRYVFGDNANGRIWSLEPTQARDGIVPFSRRDVGQATGFVVDMDEGPDGALYLAVMRVPPERGKILRIAPLVPRACGDERAPGIGGPAPRASAPRAIPRTKRWLTAGLALALLFAAVIVVLDVRQS